MIIEKAVEGLACSFYNKGIMKDAIILSLLFCAVAVLLFFGAVFLFKKSIKSTPKIESNEEYQQMMTDQRWRMQDIQQRQKDSMRDQQQRIRDLQRR